MEHLWRGSELPLAGYLGTAAAPQPPEVAIFLIVSAFLAVILHNRLMEGWECSVGMLFNNIRRRDIFDNRARTDCIWTSFAISFIIYAVSIAYGGVGSSSLWSVVTILLVFFLFREAVFFIVIWFSGRKKEITMVKMVSVSAFSLIFCASFPVALFSVFDLQGVLWMVSAYLVASLVLFISVYLKNVFKILISSGFSLFFSILYLCALEILPICVVIKALTS